MKSKKKIWIWESYLYLKSVVEIFLEVIEILRSTIGMVSLSMIYSNIRSGKLAFYGGWWSKGDGGVIHDLELDDKSLHVRVAFIRGSSEKEVNYVEMILWKTIRLSCNLKRVHICFLSQILRMEMLLQVFLLKRTNDGGEASYLRMLDHYKDP